MKLTILIHEGPETRCLGDVPIQFGRIEQRRASHILPIHPLKRAAFRLLRFCCGDRGRVAAWTRTWRGPWETILIGSQRRFLHPSRRVCERWEQRQLRGG